MADGQLTSLVQAAAVLATSGVGLLRARWGIPASVGSACAVVGFGIEQDTAVEVHATALKAVGDSSAQGLNLGNVLIKFRKFACGECTPLAGGAGTRIAVEESADLGQSESGFLSHLDQRHSAGRRGRPTPADQLLAQRRLTVVRLCRTSGAG
jgi:hypothetical protein